LLCSWDLKKWEDIKMEEGVRGMKRVKRIRVKKKKKRRNCKFAATHCQ